MLGPGMILAGTPFSAGYSMNAVRRAPDRGFAVGALASSMLQFLGLVVLLVVAVYVT